MTATITPANLPSWHRPETLLGEEAGQDVQTAIKTSGLDFTVSKVPLITEFKGERRVVEGRYGVERDTDGKIFGTVGGSWEPVQNVDGFQLIDDLMQMAGGEGYETRIESALALDGGKKAVIIVRMDSGLQIAGEDWAQYLTFINGHDGRTSVTAMACDMRIWCSNMFGQLGNLAKGKRIIRVRHSRNAVDRVKEAAQVLNMRNVRNEELARMGEWFCEHTLDEGQFDQFLRTLVKEGENQSAETMADKRRIEIAAIYHGAENLNELRGTRWGALQAVHEWADHGRTFKNFDVEIKNAMELGPQPLKLDAWNILTQDTGKHGKFKVVA